MTTFKTKTLILTLFTLWLGIFGVSTGYALTLNEAQKLLASDGAERDFFGNSVSISGDVAVIGAVRDDDNGNNSGSAYVYVRDGTGVWREQQKLTSSDGAVDDGFGRRVSLFEDAVVISTSVESAYVFVSDSVGVWHEQQKLTASDGASNVGFGNSVSLFGDTVVIGAAGDDINGNNFGSAYVFVRDGASVWREQQKLTASDGTADVFFGNSVSLFEDTAVIGAQSDGEFETGSAYVFVRDGTGLWSEQQKLTASDDFGFDNFGRSVSIDGDTIMIGSYRLDNCDFCGSVYVFLRTNTGVWREQQKLSASDGEINDQFGNSVSQSGKMAVIGANSNFNNGIESGSAYVFVRSSAGVWSEQQKLTASDGATFDFFGDSVSIFEDTVVIGAVFDDDNGSGSGSTYVFEASDPNNDLLTIEKLINHRVRETSGSAAQLLVGTRYRADYKVTNNSPDRLYRVRVFEDGQLVCNLYSLMPGQSKQPSSCANFNNVLAGLNNVPANVSAKVSGSNQALASQTNAYYNGFGNEPGKLKVTHYVNNNNADTQASAVTVNGNQAEIVFRVENTGSIKLYRVKTYHDPASPIDSGWQQQCFFGTMMPGEVRYCKRTISVPQTGLNKAFGRAQGEDANVNPTGFINAANPTYFNVVLP